MNNTLAFPILSLFALLLFMEMVFPNPLYILDTGFLYVMVGLYQIFYSALLLRKEKEHNLINESLQKKEKM